MPTRISCIVPDSKNPDHRIVRVGGTVGWSESEDAVIGEIEDDANYYVLSR